MRYLLAPATVVALAAAFALALWAAAAAAHSQKMDTRPADGATVASLDSVEIRFDEPVRLTRLRVTDPAGNPVDLPETPSMDPAAEQTVRLPALEPGRYEVEWRALSADGHPVRGRFAFTYAP